MKKLNRKINAQTARCFGWATAAHTTVESLTLGRNCAAGGETPPLLATRNYLYKLFPTCPVYFDQIFNLG